MCRMLVWFKWLLFCLVLSIALLVHCADKIVAASKIIINRFFSFSFKNPTMFEILLGNSYFLLVVAIGKRVRTDTNRARWIVSYFKFVCFQPKCTSSVINFNQMLYKCFKKLVKRISYQFYLAKEILELILKFKMKKLPKKRDLMTCACVVTGS